MTRAPIALYFSLAVIMAAFSISATVALAILQPGDTTTIVVVQSVSGPIIVALIALGSQGIHTIVNSTNEKLEAKLTIALLKIESLQERAIATARSLPPLE